MDKTLKKNLILISYTVILVGLALNFPAVLGLLMRGLSILQPVFIGIAFAFVFNLLMVRIEPILAAKTKVKNTRGLAVGLTLLAFVLVVVAVFKLVVPQLATSLISLVQALPGYGAKLAEVAIEVIEEFNITSDTIMSLPWGEWMQKFGNFFGGLFPSVFSSATAFAGSLGSAFMGLIMSIYMLANKEKLLFQLRKVLYSFLKEATADKVFEVGKVSNHIMSKFVSGQLLEAVILGVLCFVGLLVLQIPYAPLIAVIIGLTNLIPYFGPVIGTIPSAFLILMVNPTSALIFVGFILVLQQIDANIIYPRVVGESVSLPAMWIMIAILVGGGIFGLMGMLLGVPVFAILYIVVGKYINTRYAQRMLQAKNEN